MGAYYRPVIINKKGVATMYKSKLDDPKCTWNGHKLGEHSFIYNCLVADFIDSILIKRKGGKAKIVWLCDYHEPNERIPCTWDSVRESYIPCNFQNKKWEEDEDGYEKVIIDFYRTNRFLINLSKKECIDLYEIAIRQSSVYEILYYHPLPILTASDPEVMGGGDIMPEKVGYMRSAWAGDEIKIARTPPSPLECYKMIRWNYYD